MTEAETAVREALAKMTPEQKQRAREYAARFWEGTTLAHHYRAGSMDRTSAVGATAFAVMAGDAREAALLAELDAARAEVARLRVGGNDLRDRLLSFVGSLALYTDCGRDVEAIKTWEAL